MKILLHAPAKALRIAREHGLAELARHTRGFFVARWRGTSVRSALRTLVPEPDVLQTNLAGAAHPADVLAVDWTRPRVFQASARSDEQLVINWVIPGANAGSGGHQNIFRFIASLEQRGHRCRIYIYDPHATHLAATHERTIRSHFVEMQASIEVLDGPMAEADAIFATSWPTAYPVYSDPSEAARFYFVQDFEPLFYALGSEYILAENTYRFGFHGITAGQWLAQRLQNDYGMRCDSYEFGADPTLYSLQNRGERNAVLFYARPPTPRRAFELGILTLSLFAEQHPDVEIHLAGWPLDGYKTGFAYTDHGVLRLDELNELYNRMRATLVLSLTNCSLLPLELLAAGCMPVMNDAPNNRMVVDNPFVSYHPPSPHALARAIGDACVRPTDVAAIAASVQGARWEDSCERFESVLLGALHA